MDKKIALAHAIKGTVVDVIMSSGEKERERERREQLEKEREAEVRELQRKSKDRVERVVLNSKILSGPTATSYAKKVASPTLSAGKDKNDKLSGSGGKVKYDAKNFANGSPKMYVSVRALQKEKAAAQAAAAAAKAAAEAEAAIKKERVVLKTDIPSMTESRLKRSKEPVAVPRRSVNREKPVYTRSGQGSASDANASASIVDPDSTPAVTPAVSMASTLGDGGINRQFHSMRYAPPPRASGSTVKAVDIHIAPDPSTTASRISSKRASSKGSKRVANVDRVERELRERRNANAAAGSNSVPVATATQHQQAARASSKGSKASKGSTESSRARQYEAHRGTSGLRPGLRIGSQTSHTTMTRERPSKVQHQQRDSLREWRDISSMTMFNRSRRSVGHEHDLNNTSRNSTNLNHTHSHSRVLHGNPNPSSNSVMSMS